MNNMKRTQIKRKSVIKNQNSKKWIEPRKNKSNGPKNETNRTKIESNQHKNKSNSTQMNRTSQKWIELHANKAKRIEINPTAPISIEPGKK